VTSFATVAYATRGTTDLFLDIFPPAAPADLMILAAEALRFPFPPAPAR
jgi:hypothetical protein